MTTYSNPRLIAEFTDWPIGGANRGLCKFTVENNGKKGVRVVRQTTDKHGRWCKPKADTYHLQVAIVDGDDGKTYILSLGKYGGCHVARHDFMDHENCSLTHNPERFAELTALLNQVQ